MSQSYEEFYKFIIILRFFGKKLLGHAVCKMGHVLFKLCTLVLRKECSFYYSNNIYKTWFSAKEIVESEHCG